MGDLAREQGNFSEAERLFEHAAAIFKDATGEQHEFYVHQLSNLGSVYLAQQRYRDAEKTLRSAVDRLSRMLPDHRYTGPAQIRLAATLSGEARYAVHRYLHAELVARTLKVRYTREPIMAFRLMQ